MMLEHLGHPDAAEAVNNAIAAALADGTVLTPDLGGSAGTKEVTEHVVELVEAAAG